MKKRFSRFLAMLLVLCLIFTNVSFAECLHDWDFLYDPVGNYEAVNENYHKIVSETLYYICNDCGETKVETEYVSTQHESKHNFNSQNICYDCGYEGEAVHEHDWEFQNEKPFFCDVIDETYHEVTDTVVYYACTGCEETKIEFDTVSIKARHNFNNDVCVDCGYKKVIEVTHMPTVEPTDTPTTAPTDTPTPVPTDTPTAVPTDTPTAMPTDTPTAVPTDTPTPVPTEAPTVAPTDVPTPTFTNVPMFTPIVTVVPTEKPIVTAVPTEKPTDTVVPTPAPTTHVCTYKDSHWRQDFKYFDEDFHSYSHVITPICTVCGQKGEQTRKIDYAYHKYENGICEKCKHTESLASEEEKKYATERIKELDTLLSLVIAAMKNGEILDEDANNAIKLLSERIYNYKEVQNGTRKFSTIEESPAIDVTAASEAQKLLIKAGFGRNVPDAYRVAYYQMIHGLEVTGWVTEETYYSIVATTQVKAEISEHLVEAKNYSAEKLVDLIGSGIQFIQSNKDNEAACDAAYAEIEILVKYLKQKPEYLSNYSLADVDWIFKVGEETPGFKDLVDLAFTKENIYSNGTGTLVKDYLDQYNMQYVANTLTVIDGVLIISVGGVIGYEYATTGTVVLTVGTQSVAQVYDQVVAYGQKVMNLSKQTIDHIFKGYVKNNGKISGVHFEKYLDKGVKVVRKGTANSYGVYQGEIYVNGNLAKASSTFFPENWSYTQVIDAINQAYNNISVVDNVRNTLIGTSNIGIKIEFLLNSVGEIISAYPLLK